MDANAIRDYSNIRIQHMITDIENGKGDLDLRGGQINLDNASERILEAMSSLDTVLDDIKSQLAAELTELEKEAMIQSYTIYENNGKWPDVTDHVLKIAERTVLYDEDDIARYKARIKMHGSWKHAGLFIRPLDGTYLQGMLPCDPLYVVDETPRLLDPTRQLFTKQYQRRLRYYLVDEEKRPLLTEKLPIGQLGFIHAHEFFNVRPISVIQEYLTEFWELLKPGGIAMFTYNNGEIPGAVKNFEAGLYCYVPKNLLIALAESIGFELVKSFDSDYNVSWLEIRKPGELESIRGGQTLGKVKHVNQSD
jgi:SAM-dependent methyltransferase